MAQPKVFISYRRSDSQARPAGCTTGSTAPSPACSSATSARSAWAWTSWRTSSAPWAPASALIAVIGPDLGEGGRRARPAARRSPTTSCASRSARRWPARSASSRCSSATPRWSSDEQLPDDLKPLARWNAIRIVEDYYDQGIEKLVRSLVPELGEPAAERQRASRPTPKIRSLRGEAEAAIGVEDWFGAIQALQAALSLAPTNSRDQRPAQVGERAAQAERPLHRGAGALRPRQEGGGAPEVPAGARGRRRLPRRERADGADRVARSRPTRGARRCGAGGSAPSRPWPASSPCSWRWSCWQMRERVLPGRQRRRLADRSRPDRRHPTPVDDPQRRRRLSPRPPAGAPRAAAGRTRRPPRLPAPGSRRSGAIAPCNHDNQQMQFELALNPNSTFQVQASAGIYNVPLSGGSFAYDPSSGVAADVRHEQRRRPVQRADAGLRARTTITSTRCTRACGGICSRNNRRLRLRALGLKAGCTSRSNTAAKCSTIRSSTSAIGIDRPVAFSSDVTPRSAMPHGTISWK